MGAAATENSSSPGLRGYLLRAASGLYMPRPRPREAVSPGRLVQVNWTASTGADPASADEFVSVRIKERDFANFDLLKGHKDKKEIGFKDRFTIFYK